MTFSLAARRTQRQVICATFLCLNVMFTEAVFQFLKNYQRSVLLTRTKNDFALKKAESARKKEHLIRFPNT